MSRCFRVLPLPSFRVLEEPGYHLHGVWSITGFHDLTVGRYDRMLKEFEPLVQQFLHTGAPSAGVSVVVEFAQWEVFGGA